MSIELTANPFELFAQWFTEAKASKIKDPTAMALATTDEQDHADVRMVLLKDHGPDGFVFYTNLHSVKGQQLAKNPWASLCFYWWDLDKQVRIRGPIEAVDSAVADTYFASRARQSQIGAWASRQSEVCGPLDLEKRIAQYVIKFGVSKVPRPEHWSGFCLKPDTMEFWHERPFRLHDRVQFKQQSGLWVGQHLFP